MRKDYFVIPNSDDISPGDIRPHADLTSADLSNADLTGADLSSGRSFLSETTEFTGAPLYSHFRHTDLSGAFFREVENVEDI